MVTYFYIFLCLPVVLECYKKPSVNFLIQNESLVNLFSNQQDTTREIWYTRCIQIQEAYVKKIICNQIHTWSEQLYSWYQSSIFNQIETAENTCRLEAIDNQNIQSLQDTIAELGFTQQLIICEQILCPYTISQQYGCSMSKQYFQVNTNFLQLTSLQQLFIVCTLIASYIENDFLFENAITNHIVTLRKYHTCTGIIDKFPGLVAFNITSNEIAETEKLLSEIWPLYVLNRSQIKGLFLMTKTSLYRKLLNNQILYQNYPTESLSDLQAIANYCCLDFLNGIILDYQKSLSII